MANPELTYPSQLGISKEPNMAAINVDKLSLKELVVLETKIKSALGEARNRERSDLKKKMAELAKTHGFSVSE
jgi:DNA-binding protein H-NS